MLNIRQSIPAIVGCFFSIGLADGEPTKEQLIASLIVTGITVAYVIVISWMNGNKYNQND